jgi:hypothetical protein
VLTALRSGEAVAGVALRLYKSSVQLGSDSLVGTAISDASGVHVFPGLADGSYYLLAALPSGYLFRPYRFATGGDDEPLEIDNLVPKSGAIAPIRVPLFKIGSGTIVARMIGTDGKGIPGLSVQIMLHCTATGYLEVPCLEKRIDSEPPSALSDDGGWVTFNDVPFGDQVVVVDRPVPYRDFVALRDSLSKGSGLDSVEAGTVDTNTIVLAKCTGEVRVHLRSSDGAPLGGRMVALYTPETERERNSTDATGNVVFANEPCATQFGVHTFPTLGGALIRGETFQDGILLTNGLVVDITLEPKS